MNGDWLVVVLAAFDGGGVTSVRCNTQVAAEELYRWLDKTAGVRAAWKCHDPKRSDPP